MPQDDSVVQTTLRIRPSLKAEVEAAAAEAGRSYSQWIAQAITEKLARTGPPPPVEPTRHFTAVVTFSFPTRQSAVSLARVTAASLGNAARDVGARDVNVSLSGVIGD